MRDIFDKGDIIIAFLTGVFIGMAMIILVTIN